MKRAVFAVLLATLTGAAGCPAVPLDFFPFNLGDPPPNSDDATLRPFTSAREMADFLASQSAGDFGRDEFGGGFLPPVFALGGAPAPAAQEAANDAVDQAAGDGSITGGDGDFSSTTIQEIGVDESDVVKNDGTYIYVLTDSRVRIVQAQPGDALAEIGSVDLDGFGTALFLRGDQLIALSDSGGFFYYDDFPVFAEPGFVDDVGDIDAVAVDEPVAADVDARNQTDDEAPATTSIIAPTEPRVTVTIIDVSDRTAPAIARTVNFEGNLANSRLINGHLHLVLQKFTYFPIVPLTEDELIDMLPKFEGEGTGGVLVEPTAFLHPPDPVDMTLTTVATLDLDDAEAEVQTLGVVGGGERLYASVNALYLSGTKYTSTGGAFAPVSEVSTEIHKIALTDAGPRYVGSGKVPGATLDQYSFSEHDGYLRVATTADRFSFDAESSNNVYVLDEADSALTIVGELTGLAPGERIYSARSVGTRGFMVTFREVDPLYTIDLSDPTNPFAVGELKIPGFSTFILPISETELLTIGQDADEQTGRTRGLQLSVFDVSNFADPQLAHKVILGLSGSVSEALHNPKALTWFAGSRLLAVPGSLVEAGTADFAGGLDFTGLLVYHVNANDGFIELGRISTLVLDDQFGFGRYAQFTRGVFMSDDVFAVTPDVVRGAPLGNVNSVPYSIALP